MLSEFTVLHHTISMYGVCAAVGAISVLLYLQRYEKHCSCSAAGDIDLALIAGLIGGVIGAKLLYLLVNFPALVADLRQAYSFSLILEKYFFGGFVFYGGLFGYLFALVIYARCEKITYRELEKPLLPAFVLFHAFGRIGCFFAGCCYGIQTSSFLHIIYTQSKIAPNGMPLFPVQLIEASGEFVLFIVLSRLSKKDASPLTGLYLLCYGIMRFILEFFRGDFYRGKIWFLSVSQAISLVGIGMGIYLILRIKKMTVK